MLHHSCLCLFNLSLFSIRLRIWPLSALTVPQGFANLIPFLLLLLLCGPSVLWIMLSLWLLLLSCLSLLSRISTEEGLEFPSFDGKDRVLNINERNYKKALKKYDMLCLLYHEPLPSDREQQFHMREMVLEVRSDGQIEKDARKMYVGGDLGELGCCLTICWFCFYFLKIIYWDFFLYRILHYMKIGMFTVLEWTPKLTGGQHNISLFSIYTASLNILVLL